MPQAYLTTLDELRDPERFPYQDLKDRSLSVCTDGTYHNTFELSKICRGNIGEVTEGGEIYLWLEESYVKVRSSDD